MSTTPVNTDYLARYLASIVITTTKAFGAELAATSMTDLLFRLLGGMDAVNLTEEQTAFGDDIVDLVEHYINQYKVASDEVKTINDPAKFDEELRNLLNEANEDNS